MEKYKAQDKLPLVRVRAKSKVTQTGSLRYGYCGFCKNVNLQYIVQA